MALINRSTSLRWAVQAALLGLVVTAQAQDEVLDSTAVEAAAETSSPAAAEAPVEEVIVTGSRLKRDTFSSIAPLQVITTEFSKEVGLIDAADILQDPRRLLANRLT